MAREKVYADNATRQAAYRARKTYRDAQDEISRLHAKAKDAQDAARVYRDALQHAALTLWKAANDYGPRGWRTEEQARAAIDRMSLRELLQIAERSDTELQQLPRRVRQQEAIAHQATEQLRGLGL